jgi:broad specificity phosphatase PhoE
VTVPTIYFIRHGETDWNAEGRLQGQTEQPLNARGLCQAAQAGETLGRLTGTKDLPFLCSPMLRTRQTMEQLRAALGLPIDGYAIDQRLIELSFGRWEGLIWPDVSARDPALAAEREKDKWHFTPPGGESYAALGTRIMPWAEALPGPVVAVSHGGVARVLMTLLCGVDPARAAIAEIRQGQVLLFEAGRYRWIG